MDKTAIILSVFGTILSLLILGYVLIDYRRFKIKAEKESLNIANMRKAFKGVRDEVDDDISGKDLDNLIDINNEARRIRDDS